MRKRRKPLRFWIIILLFFGLSAWGIFKITNMAWGMFTKDRTGFQKIQTINYKKSESSFIYPFDEGILVYDQEKIRLYNGKKQADWEISRRINQPMADETKDILFLGDKQTGNIIAIDRGGKIIWSINLKHPLKKIKADETGYVVVDIMDSKDGEKLIVINPKGKIEGDIAPTKGDIIDFAIKKDIICISVLNIEEYAIDCHIMFYSLKGKLLGANKNGEEIISNLFFDSKNKLFAIGTKNIKSLDRKGKLHWSKEIPGTIRRIVWNPRGWMGASLSEHKNAALSTEDQNNIWIINSNGEEMGNINIRGNILGFHSKNNNLAAFTERTVYIFAQSGKIAAEKKISNDIQAVYLLPKNRVAMVFKNKTEIFQWKNRKRSGG